MNRSRSKKLSPQETLVLGIMVALAFILGFYFLVYQGFNKQEERLKTQISELKEETEVEEAKIRSIKSFKKATEEGKKLGSAVEPYDNSNTEWAVLSGFLKKYTTSYNLAFKDPPEDDVYARRAVSVNFMAPDLKSARAAIDSIADCKYRNIITDMILNAKAEDNGINGSGPVSCSFTITFLESLPIEISEE